MFGDKKVVMPSNVVTPSLRAELEKLGVPFKETDNQGKERYSLSSSNKSVVIYDKANGTNVKDFFEFLRNGKVFEKGKPNLFHIANAGTLLQNYGIKGKFMVGEFTYSKAHTQDEARNLGVKEWVDVINTINEPLAIVSYKGRDNDTAYTHMPLSMAKTFV